MNSRQIEVLLFLSESNTSYKLRDEVAAFVDKNPLVKVSAVDIHSDQNLIYKYNVRVVPMALILVDGVPMHRFVSNLDETLTEVLEGFMNEDR